jgi:hypothetical protein
MTHKKIFAFASGGPQSGKTTAAGALDGYRLPFADRLKHLCRLLHPGCEAYFYGSKKADVVPGTSYTGRELMQHIGLTMRELDVNIWVKQWVSALNALKGYNTVVVDDLRFRSELDVLHELGATIFYIHRAGYESSHESEGHIQPTDCHHVINNDGTVDDLQAQVIRSLAAL